MSKHEDSEQLQQPVEPKRGASKKPYRKPAFRHERVFETMALACGKIDATQGSCHNNRKLS